MNDRLHRLKKKTTKHIPIHKFGDYNRTEDVFKVSTPWLIEATAVHKNLDWLDFKSITSFALPSAQTIKSLAT